MNDILNAIRSTSAKGYRLRDGKYETFVSVDSHNKSLGTFQTEEEAQKALYDFKVKRFLDGIHSHNLNENDCVITGGKYAVFRSGEIFNLFGKEVIGCIDRCGYKEVILNGKMHRVHRIVAGAFLANKDNKPCINHKDGNKLNNHANNLEWVTYSENTKHAYKEGLEKARYGEDAARHKLTTEEVKRIRQLYKRRDSEYGATALGKRFNVDRTTITDIVNFRTWRFVK